MMGDANGSNGSNGANGANGSRIHLLGHQSPKPTRAEQERMAAQVTVDAIDAIARKAATDQVQEVVEHYMAQVPALVAAMLAKAFAAHGLTLQPPKPPETPSETPADTPAETPA